MQDNQLDNIARLLAQGVPRRQVVKMLIAGAVSSIVGTYFSKPAESSIPKAPLAAIQTCSPEALQTCVDMAANDFEAGIQPCASQCADVNAPACQTCVSAAANHAIGIVDTCIEGKDLSCADELIPNRVFLPLVQSQDLGKTSAAQLPTAGAIAVCKEAEMSKCRSDAATSANLKLASTCLPICILGGPLCVACVAFNLAYYLNELSKCIRDKGCEEVGKFCSNNVCCPFLETGCGGTTCCSSSEQCLNGTCCNTNLVCGNVCCPDDMPCREGICCPTSRVCGDALHQEACCLEGEVCCSDKYCCPVNHGWQCTHGDGDCCPNEWVCGDICCNLSEFMDCCGGVCISGRCP